MKKKLTPEEQLKNSVKNLQNLSYTTKKATDTLQNKPAEKKTSNKKASKTTPPPTINLTGTGSRLSIPGTERDWQIEIAFDKNGGILPLSKNEQKRRAELFKLPPITTSQNISDRNEYLKWQNKKYGTNNPYPNEYYMWNLSTPDGTVIGEVNWDVMKNVVDGTLDSYVPKNDSEKEIINRFRSHKGFDLVSNGKSYGKVTYDDYINIDKDDYKYGSSDIVENYKKNATYPLVVKTDKGYETLGYVSKGALDAIKQGKLEDYQIKSTDEADTILKYNEWRRNKAEKDGSSEYSYKVYGELTNDLIQLNDDLESGKITDQQYRDKWYEINLWRVENADEDELDGLIKELESDEETRQYIESQANYYIGIPSGNDSSTTTGGIAAFSEMFDFGYTQGQKEAYSYIGDLNDKYDSLISRAKERKGIYEEAANAEATTKKWDLKTTEEIKKEYKNNDEETGKVNSNLIEYFTPEEKNVYYRLEGIDSRAAYDYYNEMSAVLKKRKVTSESSEAYEYAKEHPYKGAMKSIGWNLIGGIPAAIDNVFDKAINGEVDTYDTTSAMIRKSQSYRSGGSAYMLEKYGQGAAWTYQMGNSVVENIVTIAATKGIGNVAGLSAKAVSGIASGAMAMNAASNQMIAIADRGGNDWQILVGGTAAGVAEYMFEKFSIEKLFSPNAGNWVLNMVRQSGFEASEELGTDVASIISDTILMGQQSESKRRERELVMSGEYTAEEAVKKVFMENLDQVLQAAASGAASGGIMSGGMSVINYGYNKSISNSIEKNASIPNIVQTIAKIEKRPSSYYTSKEAIDTANAVLKMANGTATQADYALIERSDGARTVVLSAEGTKAWDSLKAEANRRMRSDATSSTAKAVPLPFEEEGSGVKYRYAGKTKSGIKKYVTDFPADMDTKTREKTFKDRIATIFNLGAVKLNTDTKKIQVMGDDLTSQKNLYGDKKSTNEERNAKINSLYDIAEILSDSKYVGKEIEPSFKDSAVKPKNQAHKDVKYWYKFKNTISMDGVIYDVTFSIRDKGKSQYQYLIDFHKKGDNSNQPYGSKSLRRAIDELSPEDSISKDKATVNSKDMQKGGKDAHFEKKVPSPEEAKKAKDVDKGIVVSEESKKLKKENLKAYNNIGKLATSLNTRAVVVSGLKNSKGEALAGKLSGGVIYVNADVSADKISRWAALHEASHLIKQKAAKIWQRFENYAIKRLEDTGEYKVKYELKKDDYKAAEINEELACDYIGELFESEAELTEFIRTDKSLAIKVRDFFYNALSKMGLFGERKKAQALWLKAYKAAMKSDAKSEQNKFKIITMSDGSGRKYVHATQRVIKSKDPAMWESEIIDYVNKTVRKGNDVVIPFDNDESITITGRTAWKLGDKGKMPNKFYLVKGNAAGVIDEVVEVSKSVDSSPPYKEHSDDFAKYGFDYRRAYFMDLDGKYYELTLSVGINEEGKEAYNIGYIKRTTFPVTGSKARSSKLYGKSSSTPMVSQDKPGVKNNSMQNDGNYDKESVLGTRLSETEAKEDKSLTSRLLEENARLRDNIEDLYVQMNQTEGKLNTRAVNDVAKSLKEKYGSKISIPTLRRELAKLYTYMSGKNVDGAIVLKRISSIAKDVIDNATETVYAEEYGELIKTIKETRIQVPEDDKASFSEGYENFRKHNMGKLKLVKEGYPLDALWSDLVSDYPYLFSEDLTGSEERLNRILEVREEIRPSEESIYKTEAEYDNAVTELENAIMGSFFEIPEGDGGNYTFFETKYTDRFSREKLKKRIDSDFTYLHNMLKNPTDQRHIPEHLRAEVAAVLDCIKFETKKLDKIRDAGKEAQSPTAIKLAGISGLYEDIIRKAWGVENKNNSKLLDEYLSADLLELKESIPVDKSGEFKRLQDMSTEELRVIGDVLRGIHHAVTKSNQAFTEGIKTTIDEASDNVVAELATTRSERKGSGQKLEYGKEKGIGKAIGAIDEFMNVEMIQPWDMFHNIGGTLEKIFGENRKAFDRHIVNLRKASDAIKAAIGDLKVKKMTGKGATVSTFELSDGSSIEIDKGQLLSLYALYKRPQGKEHLLSGGIVTGRKATDSSGNKVSGNEIHRVSETDLGKMFEALSAEEKKMVEDIVRFMSKECAAWGNEASMKLYGYEKYGEGWYFPITVADTTLQMWSGGENEGNLRTQSFTKRLVKNAGNAVVVSDFFDTVTGHINGMSLYNTIALPMLDMERVLNHKTEGETVRQAINITYGKAVNRYINKWLEDVNGSKKITDDGGLTEKFFKNAKKASIGLNARVLVQQPTSITRALLFMNPADLTVAEKALIHPANTIKEMQEHVPIAYWKSLGFRDVGVGSSLKDAIIDNESVYDKVAMGGYGLADDMTWALIYTAVKTEVHRKNPDIEVGSDAYWEKVVDRFNYIVDRSQVVDSVFHRSQIMRSNNAYIQTATMFMSEPIKNLNMYRTELMDAAKTKDKKTIAKKVSRATAVYIYSNLILALVQALPDAWREEDEKELYDEKGKRISFGEMYLKKLGINFLYNVNPLTGIPYVKDLISMIKGYSMDRAEYSALVKTINSVKALWNDKIPLSTKLWNVFKNGAPMFGLAPGNLARDLAGIIKSIMRGFGDEYVDYTLTKINWDVKNPGNKSKFMKFYEKAIANGHVEDANIILNDYLSESGIDLNNKHSEKVIKEASKLYGTTDSNADLLFDLPKGSFTFEGEEIAVPEKEYDEYAENYYNNLWDMAYEFVTSEEYDTLTDEEKVKGFGEIKTYSKAVEKTKYVDGYELKGWKKEVYEGETEYIDSLIERKNQSEYEDSIDIWKENNFEYNESDYSPEELGVVGNVESDAAKFYVSLDKGIPYDEGDYRYMQVYHDYLSNKMSLEEYAGVRAYAKKTASTMGEGSENSMSIPELKAYLDSTDYPQSIKAALFESIGNKNWKNPYTGAKIGSGKAFPVMTKSPQDETEETPVTPAVAKTESKSGASKSSGTKSTKTKPVNNSNVQFTAQESKVIKQVTNDAEEYYKITNKSKSYKNNPLRHMHVYDTKLSKKITLTDYATIRAKAMNYKNIFTPESLKEYIDTLDYDENIKNALFEAIGEEDWENPYTEETE